MLLARHHSDAMPPRPKCLIFWALTLHDKIPMTNLGLIDILIVIGDKTISNFLHGTTQVPIDFLQVPALEAVEA